MSGSFGLLSSDVQSTFPIISPLKLNLKPLLDCIDLPSLLSATPNSQNPVNSHCIFFFYHNIEEVICWYLGFFVTLNTEWRN